MKLFKRENESMGTVHFDSSEVSQNELSPSTRDEYVTEACFPVE